MKMYTGLEVVIYERHRVTAADATIGQHIQATPLFDYAGTLGQPTRRSRDWVEFVVHPRMVLLFRRGVLHLIVPINWVQFTFPALMVFRFMRFFNWLPVIDIQLYYQHLPLADEDGDSRFSVEDASSQIISDPSLIPSALSLSSMVSV